MFVCLFVCFCLFKLAKQKGEKEISTAELQKKKKTHTLKHVLPERKIKKKKIERVESGMDFFLGVVPLFPVYGLKIGNTPGAQGPGGGGGAGRQAILSKMCDAVGVVPTLVDSQHFLLLFFFLLFASS